jgi:hypothetical protein
LTGRICPDGEQSIPGITQIIRCASWMKTTSTSL